LERFGKTRYFKRCFEKSEKTINCVKTRGGCHRQGSVLSPILLNVIMNEICNKIREKKETDLKAFIYADDIWGEDVKECETKLTHWEK
jgi:retron-type reverse transcriptase